MPTYEYLCKACSHRFEMWQKMIDDPLEICPECGGHIRRVYYPAGIVFKGSGFYKTDHRSSAAIVDTNDHEATKQDKSTDAAASETKTPAESKSSASESHPGRTLSGGQVMTDNSSKSTAPSENKVTASTRKG